LFSGFANETFIMSMIPNGVYGFQSIRYVLTQPENIHTFIGMC